MEFPWWHSGLWIQLVSLRMQFWSLASVSGLRIRRFHELRCRSHGSDLVLLWLWPRSAAASLIGPLAWELLYAIGVALKRQKKRKLLLKHTVTWQHKAAINLPFVENNTISGKHNKIRHNKMTYAYISQTMKFFKKIWAVFVSYCSHNKLPQTQWFNTTKMDYLRGQRSEVWCGFHWAEIKDSARPRALGRLRRCSMCWLFPACRGLLPSLACGSFLHPQISRVATSISVWFWHHRIACSPSVSTIAPFPSPNLRPLS